MMVQPECLETSLAALGRALATASIITFDYETSDVRPRIAAIVGLGVYFPEPHRVFYINVGHTVSEKDFPRVPESDLADTIRPFLENPANHAIAHNAPYELRMSLKLGIDIRCRVSCSLIHTHRTDENLRSDGREKTTHVDLKRVTYGLKELLTSFFGEIPPSLAETTGGLNPLFASPSAVGEYCALDCINCWEVYQRAREIIDKDHRLRKLMVENDDPNNIPLARMMWEGIGIDVKEVEKQKGQYLEAIQACREAIWSTLGINWGIDTPTEVLNVLRHMQLDTDLGYDPFYIPLPGEGNPSIAREVLEDVFEQCSTQEYRKVIALFLSKWTMEQRTSSFLRPLSAKTQDGRVYPSRFSSTLVTTRFSSSPNIQNLPKRGDAIDEDEEKFQLLPKDCDVRFQTRDIFRAKTGYTLVSMDLKAAEPRYLAMLFQKALEQRDTSYLAGKARLQQERWAKYPKLMDAMFATRDDDETPREPIEIMWPSYFYDPLWKVFRYGKPFDDPYNALLAAIDRDGYEQAQKLGEDKKWLKANRWRGKKAFLALAYGSQAETLAPGLKWSVERTREAIAQLESEYATLAPLRQLTMMELIHLGEVRTLWGRPRRINGYYQLARPNPCVVQFYRMRPTPRTYEAHIIPLGTIANGVQAFIKKLFVVRQNSKRLVLAGNTDGSIQHIDRTDVFVRAPHFNKPPFRNVNFSQLEWVEDEFGFRRFLPRQSRAGRQAFNAMCQSTGADHLRWLMNRMDTEICSTPEFEDCRLVLTVHDSLVYEVPYRKAKAFARAALPIMTKRPEWMNFDMPVEVEIGKSFGAMKEYVPP